MTAFSRHITPDTMYRVRTECGREVLVTEDHNFLSLRDGEVRRSATTELTSDDYLPLPLTLEAALPTQDLARIDLLDTLSGAQGIDVFAPEAFGWVIEQAGWPAVRAVLLEYYPEPSNKRWHGFHGTKDRNLPLAVFCRLLHELKLDPPASLVRTI